MKAKETAIVFIEFQNDFCKEKGALYGGVKDQIKAQNTVKNAQDCMQVEMKATRFGFGEELNENPDPNIVALGADISGSICINMFYDKKPERKNRFFSARYDITHRI